ncbi:terminase small subunit [Pseudomonas aeruginosa]|nr:terminase small subunit [Pseudomonas aeruginosa]
MVNRYLTWNYQPSRSSRRRGWSRAYVSKLKSQGRLVLGEGGKIDVEATEQLLAESSDPSKAGVAERHQRDRADKGVHAHVTPTAPASLPAPSGGGSLNFQKARAHREHYLALLAEDEFRKGRGELVERSGGCAASTGAQSARPADGAAHEGRGRAGGYHRPLEMEQRLTSLIRVALEEAASQDPTTRRQQG